MRLKLLRRYISLHALMILLPTAGVALVSILIDP